MSPPMSQDNQKKFEVCNLCQIFDSSPLVHCAVCCHAFHMKCVLPNVPLIAFDAIERSPNFAFYCNDHTNFCVHKLLQKISSLETKFSDGMQPMIEIYKELEQHKEDLSNSSYLLDSVAEANKLKNINSAAAAASACFVNRQPRGRKRTNTVPPSCESPKRRKETESLPTPALDPEPMITDVQEIESGASIQPPILVSMKPDRSIFLSRLHCDTTVDNIKEYIKYHTKIEKEFTIRKMNFKAPRTHSSFVVNVGPDDNSFKLICDNKIWPEHTIVREYTFLPKAIQTHTAPPILTIPKAHSE